MSHLTTSSSSSDPVPQPNIEIQKKQEVNNFCHLQLSCKIPDQSITYTWYGNSRALATGPQSFMLEVTVNSENHSTSYTCEVSNPVSSKNDTVYFTLPCQLGKKYSWGWGGGHRVTSFLLDEVKKDVGILFGLPLGWRIPKASERPERPGFCSGTRHHLSASSPGVCGAHCVRLQRVAGAPTPLGQCTVLESEARGIVGQSELSRWSRGKAQVGERSRRS